MPNDWYIKINNTEHGPLTSERLRQLAQQGKVTPETPLRKGPSGNWVRASSVKGLQFYTPTPEIEILENPVVVDGLPPPESSRVVPYPSSPNSNSARPVPAAKPFVPQPEVPKNGLPPISPRPAHSQEREAVDPLGFLGPSDSELGITSTDLAAAGSSATKTCPFCGETILLVAQKCKHCGEFLYHGSKIGRLSKTTGSEKRILPLFLLWFFFGLLGLHKFYAGRVGGGLASLVLVAIVGFLSAATQGPHGSEAMNLLYFAVVLQVVFLFIDLIPILGGTFKDGTGQPITKWT